MTLEAITISTLGDLMDHHYTVYVDCGHCRTPPKKLDLAKVVERLGRDFEYTGGRLKQKLTCPICKTKTAGLAITPPYDKQTNWN